MKKAGYKKVTGSQNQMSTSPNDRQPRFKAQDGGIRTRIKSRSRSPERKK